jgi:hypothetical protein
MHGGHLDGHKCNRHRNEWTDGLMEGRTKGQSDRQTDRRMNQDVH